MPIAGNFLFFISGNRSNLAKGTDKAARQLFLMKALRSTMKIEHLAIWVDDLERMKEFYSKYFDMQSGEKYTNSAKQCTSNFLHFGREMTRLEIMHKPGLQEVQSPRGIQKGITEPPATDIMNL